MDGQTWNDGPGKDRPKHRKPLAERLVRILHRPDGSWNLRQVHAIGIGAKGRFVPSDVAAGYCRARHFQPNDQGYPATVRFSNGSGADKPHDGWSDVRGMATRFDLGDGTAHDLIAMTLPVFFTATPEDFFCFAFTARPKRYVRQSPWSKIRDLLHLWLPMRNPYPGEVISPDAGAIRFANQNPVALPGVSQAATIGAPVSYARAAYHAVHTFIITDPKGVRRWVRFTWQPVLGVLTTNPEDTPVDQYLQKDLRQRLDDRDPTFALTTDKPRFTLTMTIGETGDDFANPARAWPPHRKRVMMGTLMLDALVKDQIADCEKMSFNPGLLPDGIEMSDDPVLRIRKEAYRWAAEQRKAACPFAGGMSDGH